MSSVSDPQRQSELLFIHSTEEGALKGARGSLSSLMSLSDEGARLGTKLNVIMCLQEEEAWSYIDLGGGAFCWVRGRAGLIDPRRDPSLLGAEEIAHLWLSLIQHEGRGGGETLTSILTGHYALIGVHGDTVDLCSDRIRSFPLFYGVCDGRLWVSDDVLWLRSRLGGAWRVDSALSLLRTAQLVTGSATLWGGIEQLQASEVIQWAGGELSKRDGVMYEHHEDEGVSEGELHARLLASVHGLVQRLIELADGSLIVVPLSGGRDSRLILTALVQAKYPKLLAFTYGQSQGAEVKISREIAKQLGVPWRFVSLTPALWRAWPASPRGRGVIERARRSGTLYHVQDPIAIHALVAEGVIPEGSVVACGHSGDLHAGSVIDQKLMNTALSEQGLIDLIAAKYFRFNAEAPLPRGQNGEAMTVEEVVQRGVSARFSKRARAEGVSHALLVDEVERWVWRERISKFLVQSMRCYEEHGLRWWLPLWDAAFTDLWLDVPLKLRGRDGAYGRFVDAYFEDVSGHPAPEVIIRAGRPPRPPLLKRLLLRSQLIQVSRLRARSPMGWYALLPLWSHYRSRKPEDHINAHLIRAELEWWRSQGSP